MVHSGRLERGTAEEEQMVTIMGATGHVGSRIGEQLLAAGERVRALGRSADTLASYAGRDAEVLALDARDANHLARAFQGADAVFTLVPPDFRALDYPAQQDTIGTAMVEAIRASGVQRVVFLSSWGADVSDGTGPIAGLHRQELRLRELRGTHVLVLRAGYFFENFFATLSPIRQQGIMGGAEAPDVPIPMVATRDIGDAAARALLDRGWTGFTVRELFGPRDLTMTEVATIIGARIGTPGLRYVQFPYAEFVGALTRMGVPRSSAELYAEMSRAINERRMAAPGARTPENATPTRFEDFAGELAAAYHALGADVPAPPPPS